MQALRAIRLRVVLLAIVALLLHATAPALHVHAQRASGDGSEWTEVCTGSGHTVLVRVDASTGDVVTAPVDAPSGAPGGDHHCPQCLTYGGVAPAVVTGAAQIALASSDGIVEDQQAPDRILIWSAERSRAPPSGR
jgi:hypothetical protein